MNYLFYAVLLIAAALFCASAAVMGLNVYNDKRGRYETAVSELGQLSVHGFVASLVLAIITLVMMEYHQP